MVELTDLPIDRRAVLDSVQSPLAGAVVSFDGVVRNHARGKKVTHLFYEAYDSMALLQLEAIRAEAIQRWKLHAASVVHRVGRMEIGESSVLIAVSASHRQDAFEACRYIIDAIKTRVPIWKKEHYLDGEIWIEEYGG
ncbi:MAG TPA: molybdenum cofactor biosynthesis protein MoaE [Acidobacteriota bacterium]|nr:molybdenum cofactor biosynthesis protein MoaE [Acidobacteriota bacterium]